MHHYSKGIGIKVDDWYSLRWWCDIVGLEYFDRHLCLTFCDETWHDAVLYSAEWIVNRNGSFCSRKCARDLWGLSTLISNSVTSSSVIIVKANAIALGTVYIPILQCLGQLNLSPFIGRWNDSQLSGRLAVLLRRSRHYRSHCRTVSQTIVARCGNRLRTHWARLWLVFLVLHVHYHTYVFCCRNTELGQQKQK